MPMSPAKQRAFLDLLARAPWNGESGGAWELTAIQLERFYHAIPDYHAMCQALGVSSLSDRKANRALTLLKGRPDKPETHFIKFTKGSGNGWSKVDA